MSAYEICRLDAVELAKLIRTRELSAVEVMQAHLDRIETINPKLNAMVTVLAEQALNAAHAADEAVAAGNTVGHCTVCRSRSRTRWT